MKLILSEIDECASEPCYNAGSCIDSVNRFTCQCVDPFHGRRCGQSKLPPSSLRPPSSSNTARLIQRQFDL